MRDGHRAEDSPLLLARRKAQFASLLKDTLRAKTGQVPPGAVPFVQELVFLHLHPEFVCDLPASSRINLYGLDGQSTISGLPGISERLAPAQRNPVSEEGSLLLAELMRRSAWCPGASARSVPG